MPSPVGHALAGIAVGWLVEGRRRGWTERSTLRTAAAFAAVAALPDLDLLLPVHRGPSHGIGSAALTGLIAWAITRRVRTAVAFALAYGSHLLLDWLGTDTTPPIGLMALWPFSNEYYQSPHPAFMAVSRRYWLPEFWTYNLRVLMRELLIIAPLVLIAGIMRGPQRRSAALVVTCALLQGVAGAHASAQDATPYADAVAKYRAGEFDVAREALVALGPSTLRDERRLLQRTRFGSLRDEDVTAAIMLHTEAHFHGASGEIAHLPAPHLEMARRLARRCLELLDAERIADLAPASRRARRFIESTNAREFVREWYLLLATHFQGMRHSALSAHYLQEARFLFPGDPDILLASGSHHEALTYGSRIVAAERVLGRGVRYEKVSVETELAEATAFFRAALAAAPDRAEAQLRLGRVLYQRGDLDGAARELEAARTGSREPAFRYLAALFLATVEEDRGARERARALFEEAIEILPDSQAAFVGLSALLYGDGDAAAAAEVMMRLVERRVAPAASLSARDPWWPYMMGDSWHFSRRLAALRIRVRQ